MASPVSELELQPDQFAFVFQGNQGVDANALGNFLQRAATIARQQGGELQVVALQHGSLVVIIKAIAKSAKKEFNKAPIATTASSVAIVSAIAAAIVTAMTLATDPTPLAKAGADVVETTFIKEIRLVTINQTIVIMDEGRATEVRSQETKRGPPVQDRALPTKASQADVRRLVDEGRQGTLSGEVHEVARELVFRPAGFRYYVPIELSAHAKADKLLPGHEYQVTADIMTNLGQPDRIIVHSATQI